MSKTSLGLAGFAVAIAAGALYVQHRDNAALRREVGLMRQELQRETVAQRTRPPAPAAPSVSATVTTDPSYSGGKEEMSALRDELAALRKNTDELARFAQVAQAAAAMKSLQDTTESVPANITPTSALKNAGKETPAAATETILWAATGGDVETLANSLAFTASARTKADAWFAGLSDATRQQYGSPEKVIALMIAKDAASVAGMQVVGQKEVTADDVAVRIRFANDQGQTKDDKFLMHHANDGWRLVLPDQTLQKFAKQLGGGK